MESKKLVRMKRNKISLDELQTLTKEELIERIIKLEATNEQLKSNLKQNKSEPKTSKKSRQFNFEKVSQRHVLLKFFYLGWDYQGFVVQDHTENTIENFIFEALIKCCLIKSRENCNYHRCGRTDKGVSAFSQVISLNVRSRLEDPNEGNSDQELPYCTMLNRLLPKNICFYAWAPCSDTNFSSRFDCVSRTYKYYFPKCELDIGNMEKAAEKLKGEHDFRNFCKMDVGNGVTNFIRNIGCVNLKNISDEMIELTITSSGFLWHQIRCIMSVLLLVGQGREHPDIVEALLDVKSNPCKPQYDLASEVPLTLFSTEYNNVNWCIDQENLSVVIQSLSHQHDISLIKTTMMHFLLEELNSFNKVKYIGSSDFLISGVKPKIYKPLLKRQKCISLDNRIQHYVKKKKLVWS